MNLQGVLPALLALLAISLPGGIQGDDPAEVKPAAGSGAAGTGAAGNAAAGTGAAAASKGQPLYEIEQSDIIAPISSSQYADYYAAKIGPAAWVCTDLDKAAPDTAYDNIKSYFNKGNKDSKQLKLDTWPVIETSGDKSELCVYLEKKDQCYPPTPNDPKIIRGVNEHVYRHYYGRVFWGQASDKRVTYEEDLLKTALKNAGITEDKVNLKTRYLAYYPNHVREVRFDSKDPEVTELPEASFSTDFVKAAGQDGVPDAKATKATDEKKP